MDETLVFSHSTPVIQVSLITNQHLLLTCPNQLLLFSLGTAKQTHHHILHPEASPIHTFLTSSTTPRGDKKQEKQVLVTVQGKMGQNFIFGISEIGIREIGRYRTGVCGFAKMGSFGGLLFGVHQEVRELVGFQIPTGLCLFKAVFQEEKLCQSISCICPITPPSSSQSQPLTLLIAQQGCHIHQFTIPVPFPNSTPSSSQNQTSISQKKSITLPNNNEIKLITSLQEMNGKVYCLMRRSSKIYVLNTCPQLEVFTSVELGVGDFRNLVLRAVQANGQGNGQKEGQKEEGLCQIIVSNGNRILRVKEATKGVVLGQIKQSKNVEYMGHKDGVIYGCTEERQFFYLEL